MLYQNINGNYTIKEYLFDKFQSIIKSPFLKWYLLLCSCYCLFLAIDHFFIYSESIFIKANGGEEQTIEKLNDIISNFKNGFWKNIAIVPPIILIQILLVSFCLYMGITIKELKVPFSLILNTVVKSLIVFPIIDILLAIILIFTKKIETIKDTQKPDWHSLVFFFNKTNLPKWLIYPLKTFNLAEVIFLIVLIYFLKKQIEKKAILTIVLSYIISLCFWIVFVVFMQMTQFAK